MDEDFGELAGRDDELWDQIDSVVAIATKLRRRGLIRAELSVKLKVLGCND